MTGGWGAEHWRRARAQLLDRNGLVGRFARGTGWNAASMGFTVAANFAGGVVFARILGRESFGAYGIVQSTMMTTIALSSQFATAAVNRYVAQYRFTDPERTGRIIGLNLMGGGSIGLALGITLALLAPFLAAQVLHRPALEPAILVAAASVPLVNINGVFMAALSGLESFKNCAKVTGFGALAYLVVGTAGALQFGVPGALLGWFASLTVQTLFSRQLLKRPAEATGIRVRYRDAWLESGSILRFNLPAMMAAFTPLAAMWIGHMLIVRGPGGYPDMALYSAAYTMRSAVILLPYVLFTVTSSVLNSYHGQGNESEFRRAYWLNVKVTTAVAIVGAVFLAIIAPVVLKAYGKDFVHGTPIVLILLCGAVLEATWVAVYQILQARVLMWRSLLLVTLPRDILVALLAVALVPHVGARGLAQAYVAGWALALLVTVGIVLRTGVAPLESGYEGGTQVGEFA